MEQSTNDPLKTIDATTLTPLVRQVLKRPTARAVDWQSNELYGGGITTKIMRFSGNAEDENTILPWSLILKTIHPYEKEDDPTSLRYWKREAIAYQSGLLDDLPGRIRAPLCYGIVEQPEHEVWLWMEEIADEVKGKWSLDQYGSVAQHVGEFNGLFFGNESAYSLPWMTKNQLRSWVGTAAPILPPEVLAQPLVSRFFSNDIYEWMQGIWSEHLMWLDFVERQPKTLSHLDVFRRNAFSHHTPEGDSQTALIDWAFVGGAAPGEEIAPLVAGSVNFMDFDATQIHELDQVVFENYLEGLHSAGWDDDARVVRFAYAVASILKFSVGVTGVAFMVADKNQHPILERMFGNPIDKLVETWGSTNRFLVKLSDEARKLISKLN